MYLSSTSSVDGSESVNCYLSTICSFAKSKFIVLAKPGQKYFSLISLLCMAISLNGQTYDYEAVADGDWNDPGIWNTSTVPPYTLNGDDVLIDGFDVTYNDQTFTIKRGSITIINGGFLDMSVPNFKIENNGVLTITKGRLKVIGDPGNFNNSGTITLTQAYIECAGNFNNRSILDMDQSCINMTVKNFTNDGDITGNGNITVANATLSNTGNWSAEVIYCANGNLSGSFPGAESCDDINTICDCVKKPTCNLDILPGYDATTKVYDLVGSELTALAGGLEENRLGDDIFTVNQGMDSVYIDIIYKDEQAVIALLANPFGILPSDFIPNDNEPSIITVLFPLDKVLELRAIITTMTFPAIFAAHFRTREMFLRSQNIPELAMVCQEMVLKWE
jgi:hypothetical protein